ncbi:MAG: hypothetical protein H6R01_916 [Burkholderiaceae bacterium]|nr:hypothetical protein [Burkholderiaceae bacterium]
MTAHSKNVEERAFGAKCLVAAALPYRDPKPEQLVNGAWVRQNGDYTLWVQGGPLGLPYGTYPRIFVIWLTSEAVRTGNKRIVTGGSFSEFCRKLNIDRSRGKNGAGRRMVEQAERLLSSRVGIESTRNEITNKQQLCFSDEHNLFRSGSMFESEIVLTDKFFKEITEHCIPIDLRAVSALRESAFALDIYQWLAYRMFSLRRQAHPTWQQLNAQFGASFERIIDFRKAFLRTLPSVLQQYPGARVVQTDSGLRLLPSPTVVPRLE